MVLGCSVSFVFSNPHMYSSSSATSSFANIENNEKEDAEKLIANVKAFYNPISTQLSTSFKLSKQADVVIKVMDALGSEVLSLMNGALDKGLQNLSFDTEGKLTPGFYFVRITSGTETVVKRISIR